MTCINPKSWGSMDFVGQRGRPRDPTNIDWFLVMIYYRSRKQLIPCHEEGWFLFFVIKEARLFMTICFPCLVMSIIILLRPLALTSGINQWNRSMRERTYIHTRVIIVTRLGVSLSIFDGEDLIQAPCQKNPAFPTLDCTHEERKKYIKNSHNLFRSQLGLGM